MKNVIIIIGGGIILLLGSFLIYSLLNETETDNLKPTTTLKTDDEISLISEGSDVKHYLINKEYTKDFEVSLNKFALVYKNKNIYINNMLIINDMMINPNIGLYSNRLAVLFYHHHDSNFGGIIIYDTFSEEFDIIENIDNFLIKKQENINFYDLGFDLNVAVVDEEQIYINDQFRNICSLKYPPDKDVIRSIEYLYDKNLKSFKGYNVSSNLTADAYIKINNYCR